MARPNGALILPVALAIALATGCLPSTQDEAAPPTESTQPTPLPPVPSPARDAALAKGPPLRLDDLTLDGEASVLERLQDALASLEQAKAAHTELTARLGATSQAKAALEAQAAEMRQQLALLTKERKDKDQALAKAKADLAAAQDQLASLQQQADDSQKTQADVPALRKKLQEAEAANAKLRDQLLAAELARVKAQQDLVALQIVMARQRALLKRPTEARAPAPPTPGNQETHR
jgi:hypothetical protein